MATTIRQYLVYTPATTTLPALWLGEHGCWIFDMDMAKRYTRDEAERKSLLYTGFLGNMVEV